jgi:hypothetical protein
MSLLVHPFGPHVESFGNRTPGDKHRPGSRMAHIWGLFHSDEGGYIPIRERFVHVGPMSTLDRVIPYLHLVTNSRILRRSDSSN